MVSAAILAATLLQQPPAVDVAVRPERVRVGGRVVLTVSVDFRAAPPAGITLADTSNVAVIDVVDRFRTNRWERDFVLSPTGIDVGDWSVEVEWESGTVTYGAPVPTVEGGMGRTATRPPPEDPRPPSPYDPASPLPQGLPPLPHGTGAGYRSLAGGWAETAHLDPWWAEVVPEVFDYDVASDDPATGVRLEAGLAPRVVYAGQQVSLVATVTVPPEAPLARVWYWAPDPSEFDRVNVQAGRFAAARGGRAEPTHTFLTAFFPRQPGEWAFPVGGVGFPGSESLVGPSVPLTVLAVPVEAAPEGYGGAVGRYQLRAWLDSDVVAWGGYTRLRVEVLGVGDVRRIPPPVMPLATGGTVVPHRDYAWIETRDGVVGGIRAFDYLITPVEEGPIVVEPIVYTYFDPYVGDFGVVTTGELIVQVR